MHRREVLKKLGILGLAAYATPMVLTISDARASSGGGSGGGRDMGADEGASGGFSGGFSGGSSGGAATGGGYSGGGYGGGNAEPAPMDIDDTPF